MTEGGGYHHGNLKAALLEGARVQLERDGHEAVSLRALAAEIGVARSAPYRHFKSREQLLATLVAEGSQDFRARYRAAADSPGSALDRLELACMAYLAFAKERPELFRLIFETATNWETELQVQINQSMVGYVVFEDLVAATLPGADAPSVNAATVAIWAAIHGMAMLKARGRLDRRYALGLTDRVVIQAILKRG